MNLDLFDFEGKHSDGDKNLMFEELLCVICGRFSCIKKCILSNNIWSICC